MQHVLLRDHPSCPVVGGRGFILSFWINIERNYWLCWSSDKGASPVSCGRTIGVDHPRSYLERLYCSIKFSPPW